MAETIHLDLTHSGDRAILNRHSASLPWLINQVRTAYILTTVTWTLVFLCFATDDVRMLGIPSFPQMNLLLSLRTKYVKMTLVSG